MNQPKSTNLLSASLLGAVLSFVKLLTGLIKIKVIVLTLGASGVGLISQATETWLLLVSIGSLMLGGGITTQIRKNKDLHKQMNFARTALLIQTTVVTTLLLLGVFFSHEISEYLFHDKGQPLWIWLILISIPFNVISSGFLEGIILAKGHYKKYIWLSTGANLVSTGTIIYGVMNHGIEWAFWGWSINGVLLLAGYIWILKNEVPLLSFFKPHFDFSELKILFVHGLSVLVSSVIQGFSMITIRRDVIDHLGEDQLGWIQVIIAVTSYYTPFITNGLWGHFHPTISGGDDQQKNHLELLQTLKWVVILQTVFALGLHGYGTLFIRLAYSEEFLVSYPYFFTFLLGSSFYFFAFVMAVYFIANAKAYFYLIGLGTYYVIWMIFVNQYIGEMGLRSVALGHAVGAGFVFLLCLTWLFQNVKASLLFNLILIYLLSLGVLMAQHWLVEAKSQPIAGFIIPVIYALIALPQIIRKLKRS